MSDEPELCPIDLIVIGCPPGAPMKGDAIPILLDLVERRIVRVLDALIVIKSEAGDVSVLDPAELAAEVGGDLTELAGAATGLLSADDGALVGAELEPGWVAAVLMYENLWAAPFVAAVQRNGDVALASERIRVQDVGAALEETADSPA